MPELHKAVEVADAILALAPRILEQLHEGIVIVDGDLRICYVNASAEWQFDYHRSELIGQNINLLLPDDFRERHTKDTGNYMRHPQPRPMGRGVQLYGQRRGGEKFPVEISLNPHKTTSGTFVVAVIHTKDAANVEA